MKKCPFCAEEIQDAAIVCKHCGRELMKPGTAKLRTRWGRVLLGVGVLLAIGVWMLSTAANQQRVTPPPSPTVAPVHENPLALTIHPDGLSIENRADSPLQKCSVEIFGGFRAQVPIVPAHGRTDQSFIVLFDSEDHEYQAHLAGQTFDAYVLKNAEAQTSVSCQDLDGHRVSKVFRQ